MFPKTPKNRFQNSKLINWVAKVWEELQIYNIDH